MDDQKTNKINKAMVLAIAIFTILAGVAIIVFLLLEKNGQEAGKDIIPSPIPKIGEPKKGNESNEPEEDGREIGGDEIFCTMDAKECPDGSFVARDPKNDCQFRPCPGDPAQ